jgi:hypothetical protein
VKLKHLVIPISLLIGLSKLSQAQDFYSDYRKYLMGNGNKDKKRIISINTSIRRLKLTINRFEHDSGKSFFLPDTIFIIDFQGAETGFTPKIIWTKEACCYYSYSYELTNWKKTNKKFTINTHAFDILNSFNRDFRDAIEKIDTAAYTKYAVSHKVFDGEWVFPVVAIKKDRHWQFVSLKGNGWAINYDFEWPKK